MNHAAFVNAESALQYRQRSYVLGHMDHRHFAALNPGGHVLGLNGYCLDSLDSLPTGCMLGFFGRPVQACISRGLTLAEQLFQEECVETMLDEILAHPQDDAA